MRFLAGEAESNTASDPTRPFSHPETGGGASRIFQVALMTRNKSNKTVLKAVRLEQSESMHESIRRFQQQRELERQEMKQVSAHQIIIINRLFVFVFEVTLAMNDRIQSEQFNQQLADLNAMFNQNRMNARDAANLEAFPALGTRADSVAAATHPHQ